MSKALTLASSPDPILVDGDPRFQNVCVRALRVAAIDEFKIEKKKKK